MSEKKDDKRDDVTEQLAAAQRQISKLQEMLAGAMAELYAVELHLQMRRSGKLGVEALIFQSPATRGAYDVVREQVMAVLRGERPL